MEPGLSMRIMLVATGTLLLIITISSLAKRRMTEPFCLSWGLISVIFIISGIFLRPDGWTEYISHTGLVLIFLIGVGAVYGCYFMSYKVSELMRKTNELAIQMSLMLAEREELVARLEKLENKLAGEDKEDA